VEPGAESERRLLLDAYRELAKMLEPLGVRPIIVGVATRGLAKSFDITLSKPIPTDKLTSVLTTLVQALRSCGHKVLSGLIQMGRSADDWIIRIPVVVKAGKIAELRVFNMLNPEHSRNSY